MHFHTSNNFLNKDDWKNFKSFFRDYIKPRYVILSLVSILALIGIALRIANPLILGIIINAIIEGKLNTIGWLWGFFIVVQLLFAMSQYSQTMGMKFLHMKSIFNIRLDAFSRLLNTTDYYRKGDVISRIVNDVSDAQRLLVVMPVNIIVNVIYFSMVVIILSWVNLNFLKVILFFIPLYLLSQYAISKKIKVESKKLLIHRSQVVESLDEALDSIELIKYYNLNEYWDKKFIDKMEEFSKSRLKLDNLEAIASSLGTLLISLIPVLLLWIGSKSVVDKQISIGILFASYTYALRLLGPVQTIVNSLVSLPSSINAVNRISKIFKFNQESNGTKNFQIKEGLIEFRNVSFGYQNYNLILNNFSSVFQKGRLNFILGPNGSGKSTLSKLLNQIHLPTRGNIYIDGVDISLYPPSQIRKKISVASQQTQLINGTLKENIGIGDLSKSFESIEKLVKDIQMDNKLFDFENSWETKVNHNGSNVSGGQSQFISFLRALLKDAPIIILDEITANMDKQTEEKVYKLLTNLMYDKTIIIITHKIPKLEGVYNVAYLNKTAGEKKNNTIGSVENGNRSRVRI